MKRYYRRQLSVHWLRMNKHMNEKHYNIMVKRYCSTSCINVTVKFMHGFSQWGSDNEVHVGQCS